MDKSYQNKAIVFMNVKVAQWTHGGHSGVSSCLDNFKAQGGRIFVLNDKESTFDEDAHELVGLEDFVKGISGIRLLLVRDMRVTNNFRSQRRRFLDDQVANLIEKMNHSTLFDDDSESSYAKSEKLYVAVEDLKRQPTQQPQQKDITMNTTKPFAEVANEIVYLATHFKHFHSDTLLQVDMRKLRELDDAVMKLKDIANSDIFPNQQPQQKEITMQNFHPQSLAEAVHGVIDHMRSDNTNHVEATNVLEQVELQLRNFKIEEPTKPAAIKTTNIITINCDIGQVMEQAHDLTVEQLVSENNRRGGKVFEINTTMQNLGQMREIMNALHAHFKQRHIDSNYLIIMAPYDDNQERQEGFVQYLDTARQWLQDEIAAVNAQAVYLELPTSQITGAVQELREIAPKLISLMLPIAVDTAADGDFGGDTGDFGESDPVSAAIESLNHTIGNRLDTLINVLTSQKSKPTEQPTPPWQSPNPQPRRPFGFGPFDWNIGQQYGAPSGFGNGGEAQAVDYRGTIFVHVDDEAARKQFENSPRCLPTARAVFPNANWQIVSHDQSIDIPMIHRVIDMAVNNSRIMANSPEMVHVVFTQSGALSNKMAAVYNVLSTYAKNRVAVLPYPADANPSRYITERLVGIIVAARAPVF